MKYILFIILFSTSFIHGQDRIFTAEDSLRGGYNSMRNWWDLTYYDLYVEVFPNEKKIEGKNVIRYTVRKPGMYMQIDLQEPLEVHSIRQDGVELEYQKAHSSYIVKLEKQQKPGSLLDLEVTYGGHPTESVRPPWSGGITWEKDKKGNWFIASSNQSAGASIWWPCKDHPFDEVDSMSISVNVPFGLMDVSNGRLKNVIKQPGGRITYQWYVSNPINNYGVNINVGDYVHFSEVYQGERSKLDCDYYVLSYNLEKARNQFRQVAKMLEAFEYWLGPYPFYEDGYKLVEAPYLGMEHQSSVTYGNQFENGYLGNDLSRTGWGLKFDFIIIHESAHEWFANNITYADVADMWIHESFTAYCESLFVEYYYGREAGAEYVRGTRVNIANECPIQGQYGVDDEGCSGTDMYYKGANMLHTLRQIVDHSDPHFKTKESKWRSLLRGLNETFYHQTVLAEDIEGYINDRIDLDLSPFFNQYLRDTRIPVFTYWKDGEQLRYRYDNTVDGFTMPVKIRIGDKFLWLEDASDEWNSIGIQDDVKASDVIVDHNFYVGTLNLDVHQGNE